MRELAAMLRSMTHHREVVRFDLDTQEWRVTTSGTPGVELTAKEPWHPTVGVICTVCGEPFAPGDVTCAVPLGPASDKDRAACERGEVYEAICHEVHRACTGRTRA